MVESVDWGDSEPRATQIYSVVESVDWGDGELRAIQIYSVHK
jgi:hypothetical protein